MALEERARHAVDDVQALTAEPTQAGEDVVGELVEAEGKVAAGIPPEDTPFALPVMPLGVSSGPAGARRSGRGLAATTARAASASSSRLVQPAMLVEVTSGHLDAWRVLDAVGPDVTVSLI